MKKHQVFWTKQAKIDLMEIIEYIAVDSKTIAIEKLHQIQQKAQKLQEMPDKGRVIPELERQNVTRYRELIISPWRIMYKIEQKKVYVLAVMDGRRNIEDILLQRQLR